MLPWRTDMSYTFGRQICEWIHRISTYSLNFDEGKLAIFEEDEW